MTLDITIQQDLKKLQGDLSVLEHRAAPKATVRTLNVLAERSKVASSKHIAKDLGSRQAGVRRRITTRKATFKQLWSTLVASVAWFAPRFLGNAKLINKRSLHRSDLGIARRRFMSVRARLVALFA